jgi:hypothetical protein
MTDPALYLLNGARGGTGGVLEGLSWGRENRH